MMKCSNHDFQEWWYKLRTFVINNVFTVLIRKAVSCWRMFTWTILSRSVTTKQKYQFGGGATEKVCGSAESGGFILREQCMPVQNLMEIQPIAVDIYLDQCGGPSGRLYKPVPHIQSYSRYSRSLQAVSAEQIGAVWITALCMTVCSVSAQIMDLTTSWKLGFLCALMLSDDKPLMVTMIGQLSKTPVETNQRIFFWVWKLKRNSSVISP